MPDPRTFTRWQYQHQEFALAVERARELRAHVRADTISDLVDQVRAGKLPPDAGRVAIAGLQWLAGKENARKYGDRITSEVAIKASIQEAPTETQRWIEKVLTEDRTNVVPPLPPKEPAA